MSTPDAPRPAANVTEVLMAHDWFTPRGYAWPCCTCGEAFPDGEDAAYAHVAAALAEAGIGPVAEAACLIPCDDDCESRCHAEHLPRHKREGEPTRRDLAEAERRGAERGWDEGFSARGGPYGDMPDWHVSRPRNPYRAAARAAAEQAGAGS